MLSVPQSVRVFLYTQPTDMRRSFDGLSATAEAVFRQSPLSGHLFVFVNRRGDRLKILWWDRGGYAIYYRRLEEGAFQLPADARDAVEIDTTTLAMILDGVDLAAEILPRYVPRATTH